MGNKWSGSRHNTTSAKDAHVDAKTGWNDCKTSTSLAQTSVITDVAHPHSDAAPDGVLPEGITIYRSYTNATPPDAEIEQSSLAGVRFASNDSISCKAQRIHVTM